MEQYISKDFADGPSVDAALKKALNAAPGGYGLGEYVGKYITDLNETVENGWYYFGQGALNLPVLLASSAYSCALVIARTETSALQIVPVNNGNAVPGYIAIRHKINSVWQPWDYVNPPMSLGVEYRTAERYMGKPVYKKLINFGAMPAINSTKTVSHNIENINSIVAFGGDMIASDNHPIALPYYYTEGNNATLSVGYYDIRIYSGSTNITQYNAKVWIKYTKTTD